MLDAVCFTVGGSWVVLWDRSLSLMGMAIGVTIGRTAHSPLVQVSGPVSAADVTCMRHCVRFDRFANIKICYIQSM